MLMEIYLIGFYLSERVGWANFMVHTILEYLYTYFLVLIVFFYLNCVSELDAAFSALAGRGNTSWIEVMVPGCRI